MPSPRQCTQLYQESVHRLLGANQSTESGKIVQGILDRKSESNTEILPSKPKTYFQQQKVKQLLEHAVLEFFHHTTLNCIQNENVHSIFLMLH